jgi:hypothetical protein
MDNIRRIGPIDLGVAGRTRIENFLLGSYAVESYNGTTGDVVLTGSSQDRDVEAFVITAGGGATIPFAGVGLHPDQWYITNRIAQPGKTLTILVARVGSNAIPGYSILAGSANAENQATQIAFETSIDTSVDNIDKELGNKDGIAHGRPTVGITAAALPTQAIDDGFEVCLKASVDNTGKVYVGGSTVTVPAGAVPGFELSAGESVSLRVDNLNKLYAIAEAALQYLFWIVEKTA